MKQIILYSLPCLLFACGSNGTSENATASEEAKVQAPNMMMDTTPRVTGIGGIFFYSEDADSLMKWYGDHLGLAINPYGSPFEFRNANNPDEINYLQWSVHGSTEYYKPSKKEFMINYRVYNIEGLVQKLEKQGVQMLDSIVDYPGFGKFVHFMDPAGNKIELWEATDSELSETGTKTTK